jgi:hypothetical protein
VGRVSERCAVKLVVLFGVAAEACAGGSDRHVPNIREPCASHPLGGDLAVTGGLRRERTGGDAAYARHHVDTVCPKRAL